MNQPLKAPYSYFGGKSKVADVIWEALGSPPCYIEPFFGSGATLLLRPGNKWGLETVNDLDGYIANVWRAIANDPEKVAHYADYPVFENDLHARSYWLLSQQDDLVVKLEGDPDYYNAKIAGWWLWGIACFIGGGFLSGKGPWQSVDGKLVKIENAGRGINRSRPHLGDAGRGINRSMPHMGNAGRGINRSMPHLGDAGQGIYAYMEQLQTRMRKVKVCCGDWMRVMGPSVSERGLTGIVLDPPYTQETRGVVYVHDNKDIAYDVRDWALENGDNPMMRIALCGYKSDSYTMPDSWREYSWKTDRGMARTEQGKANRSLETIWFSPHCIDPTKQLSLW